MGKKKQTKIESTSAGRSNSKRNKPSVNSLKSSDRVKKKRLLRLRNNKELIETPNNLLKLKRSEKKATNHKGKKKLKEKEEDLETVPPKQSTNEQNKDDHSPKEIEEISNEIISVLDKIAKKKANTQVLLQKKRERATPSKKNKETVASKKTAKDFDYHLTANIAAEHQEVIDIQKALNNASHILLSIFELGLNPDYYQITFPTKSKVFWEQVGQYEELKPIFGKISPETMLKYWKQLSIFNISTMTELIKNKESFLNQPNIKLKVIVSALENYFDGKITDIEKYIQNIQIDINQINSTKNKQEKEKKKEQELSEKATKLKKTKAFSRKEIIEEVKLKHKEIKQKPKKEEVIILKDDADNDSFNDMKIKSKQQTQATKQVKPDKTKQLKHDADAIEHNNEYNNDDKYKLLQLIETDPFIIQIIDKVATDLMKEFIKYSKEYIIEILVANSLNISKAYLQLKEFSQKQGKINYINISN